jgi:hypothetical protein
MVSLDGFSGPEVCSMESLRLPLCALVFTCIIWFMVRFILSFLMYFGFWRFCGFFRGMEEELVVFS